MLIHDVNPRWIIKPISRAAWRTSWHGNGLFTGSRFTAFNLAASPRPPETAASTASHSNPILKEECRSMRFRVITRCLALLCQTFPREKKVAFIGSPAKLQDGPGFHILPVSNNSLSNPANFPQRRIATVFRSTAFPIFPEIRSFAASAKSVECLRTFDELREPNIPEPNQLRYSRGVYVGEPDYSLVPFSRDEPTAFLCPENTRYKCKYRRAAGARLQGRVIARNEDVQEVGEGSRREVRRKPAFD